jgi:hypothetical protein
VARSLLLNPAPNPRGGAINNVLTKKEPQSLSTLARYQGKKGHPPRKLKLSVNVLRQLGTPHAKAPYRPRRVDEAELSRVSLESMLSERERRWIR